ncbi:MAG: hypothetical protein DCF21_04865 [Leptolyngbya sp.]|jgi:hypothetical protein|uniref:DUF6737 domain-containing protein n=1 Tax=Shackletoniella antarctica TaxID=268115 RepID=A0A2W4W712_9CYAN|nr:MAG: hypothetical protein DCF17_11360 [Shackletoniella antarctica]PZV20474.1 MAG: hypothetical protein DCF21_04865 [Leptolyngbya sp.]
MTDLAPLTSPWQLKPWWCQPWSIVLTGCAIVGGSWLLLHRLWLTGLVAIPIGAWMGFFVLIWPRLMREAGYLEATLPAQQPTENLE